MTATTQERRTGPWHRRMHGLHVLKVKGSFYEMGLQHGSLLRESVAAGPLPYYRTYLEKLLGAARLGPAGRLIYPAMRRFVGQRVARAMPEFAQDTLRGLAEGAQLPYEQVMDGATMPDALVWASSKVIKLKGVSPALPYRLGLGLGCTSAVAWGEATADGSLLHARNFDYHGVHSWPNTAAVVFHEPEEGMRYVSVSAAGVPLGGITAMNEAGLSLTVHQHMFTDAAALGGTPIGLVGDEVMRHADSLDEAERILRSYTSIGCWTYLITDAHRREVLCFEENPKRQVAHRIGPDAGTFGYANIYLDKELGKTERNLYGSYWRHNAGRHRRANELLEAGRGQLDPAGMARILGDTGAADCRLHEAIAMLLTVGSVVFRPEDGTVWVGTGQAPTSHGTFVPFSLKHEDHLADAPSFNGAPEDGTPSQAAAFEAYRRAYLAYMDHEDLPEARRLMSEATRQEPQQPLYQAILGLLAVEAGDAPVALNAFSQALAMGHVAPERIASFRLWRGRALDLSGRRREARTEYESALSGPADEPVRKAARKGLSRPYKQRRARSLHIDFALADVVSP